MTALVNCAKAHSMKFDIAVVVIVTVFLLATAVAEFIIMFGS